MISLLNKFKLFLTFFLFNRKFQIILKFLIFFSSIFYIYSRVNLNTLSYDFYNFKYKYFYLIFFLQTIGAYLVLIRWKKLLEVASGKIYLKKQLASTIIYSNISYSFNFLSFFLTRLIFASKHKVKINQLFSTAIIEKILSIYSLILIFIFAIFITYFFYDEVSNFNFNFIVLLSIIIIFISLLILLILNIYYERVSETLSKVIIIRYFVSYLKFKNILLPFIYTLFLQISSFVILFITPFMLNIEINIFHFFIFIPIVTFVSALPVSFTQWGFRESVFIFFYGLIGIDSNTIFIISLTYGIVASFVFILHAILFEIIRMLKFI